MIIHITQKVPIEPQFLDSNIKTHIFNKIKQKMDGVCTLQTGYVLSVNKIIDIGDNIVDRANSLAIFNVTYEADVIKPEKGQIISGDVCMVFQHGIFVNISNKIKILIPSLSMSEYKYNNTDAFIGKSVIIKNGINVTISITMIKYENKQFSCIGKLLNVCSNTSTNTSSNKTKENRYLKA